MGQEFIDISGERFGRWLVLRFDHFEYLIFRGHRQSISFYLCQCDCGEEKVVRRANLMSGSSTSCGCWFREQSAARCGVKSPAFRHGHATRETIKTYEAWAWAHKIRKQNRRVAA
jgi:hypothetical protein